jgi:hypothetical protein
MENPSGVRSKLVGAIQCDDTNEVIKCLHDGLDINYVPPNQHHLLFYTKSREMIALLVMYGADVNKTLGGGVSHPFLILELDLCLELLKHGIRGVRGREQDTRRWYNRVNGWSGIKYKADTIRAVPVLMLLCNHYPTDLVSYLKTFLY